MSEESGNLSESLVQEVADLLGREPRGLEAVPVFNSEGAPSVIRVASLVDDKPFPTMYWLVDKALNYQIDRVEARGLIKELQAVIDEDESLQAVMEADHHLYIADRDHLMSKEVKRRLKDLGYYEDLQTRGIGGIANFTRIRCLHTYYAAHLVRENMVGRLLDEYWQDNGTL